MHFLFVRLSSANFERDFGDVVMSRRQAKQTKVQNKLQFMRDEFMKESRTYALLTMALDDLIHQRRGKRISFGRWLEAVDMESTRQESYRSAATQKKRDDALKRQASEVEQQSDTFVLSGEEEFKLHARCVFSIPSSVCFLVYCCFIFCFSCHDTSMNLELWSSQIICETMVRMKKFSMNISRTTLRRLTG